MQIFVEKNGHTMGPFTVLQLKELVASSVITKLLPAWVDGDDQMSTVGQLLASAEELATDRQRSSKLQAPPQVELHTRETIAAKFRPGRRMRSMEIPQPSVVERLRMAGAATPFLLGLFLLAPWVRYSDDGELLQGNGYHAFAALSDTPVISGLFVVVLFFATIGIAYFSFRGGTYGAVAVPAGVLGCGFVAVVALVMLRAGLPDNSRTVQHLGGANYAFAIIFSGCACGILPGHEHGPNETTTLWITAGTLALTGSIFFVIGLGMGGG